MSKKVKYTETDGLEDTDFSVAKVRITTMLDADLIEWLKQEAKKKKIKYQTYLNQIVREAKEVGEKIPEIEFRLARLEKKVG